jgi:hypothetical protein
MGGVLCTQLLSDAVLAAVTARKSKSDFLHHVQLQLL